MGLTESDVHIIDARNSEFDEWNADLQRLFGANKFKSKRTRIEAALAHLTIWQHTSTLSDCLSLVLEDSAEVQPNFVQVWNSKYATSLPHNASVLYLGNILEYDIGWYPDWVQLTGSRFLQFRMTPLVQTLKTAMRDGSYDVPSRWYFYRVTSYIISNHGAGELARFVEQFGFRQTVDNTIVRLMGLTDSPYFANPILVDYPSVADLSYIKGDVSIPGGPGSIEREEWLKKASK